MHTRLVNPSPAREAIRDAFKRALTHQLLTDDYDPVPVSEKEQFMHALDHAVAESQVWSQFECPPRTPERRAIAFFVLANASAWMNGSDEIVLPAFDWSPY